MNAPLPPPTWDLKPLADLVGLEGLLRLLETRGGTRLHVPHSLDRSELVGELGAETATALVEAHGGTRIKIPLGREWRIQVYHGRGASYTEIAVRLGLTEDGVWRSLKASGLTASGLIAPSRRRETRPIEPSRQYDLLSWISDRSE